MITDKISHEGVIASITADNVRVRIRQTSACAHCSASKQCNASESKVKWIDVSRKGMEGKSLQVGDEVVVSASRSTVGKALLLCFGIPFLLLVIILSVMIWISRSETWSALMALFSLIPYYIVLYLLRHRISDSIVFTIEDA